MARPLQYESQFVPTDFGTIGNILGQFRQDMQMRNQEYDQGLAMQNTALAELYGLETYDKDIINQRAGELGTKIEDLVKRRGMDYGAAAGDISSLISKEQANPLYALNKRKVEQVKLLEQAIAKNPNLLTLRDPRKMSLKDFTSPEEIGYDVADPADVQAAIKDVFGKRGDLVRQGDLRKSSTPGFLEAITTKGLTNTELQQMLQDPATRETLLARLPQLRNYIDNPEVGGWLDTQMQQGLQGLIGGESRQFLRDPDYDTRGGSGVGPGYIALTAGANRGLKNDRPFNSVRELNNLPKDDPRYLTGQVVKQNALTKLSDTDKQFMDSVGGEEILTELADIAPALPSIGSGLSKTMEDIATLTGSIGSLLGVGTAGTMPLGAGIPSLIENVLSAKDNWDRIKDIKNPLDDYLTHRKEVIQKYELDKLNRKERNKILDKAYSINYKYTLNLKEEIQTSYGDLLGEFVSHNYLTGDKDIDKTTQDIYKRLNDRVETIPFSAFQIMSTNSDLDYRNQDKLRKKGDEDYLYSTGRGKYRILETTVSDKLGPVYLIETDKKGGGTEEHLATLSNPNYNAQLLGAYGSANIPKYQDAEGNIYASDLVSDYRAFMNNENLKRKFSNSLSGLPKYKEFKGGTVNDYLTKLSDDPDISEQEFKDVMDFIQLTGASKNTTLK